MAKSIFVNKKNFSSLSNSSFFLISIPHDDNQWSSLLRKQEEYYQTQLNSLQNVLITTHNALKNVRLFVCLFKNFFY